MKNKLLVIVYRRLFRLFLTGVAILLSFFLNFHEVNALMENKSFKGNTEVFEVLRLHVPLKSKEAWLNAGRKSWEPWLMRQDGFLDRQLFWDPESEEAMLLIRWASRPQWKSIPAEQVEIVQKLFEEFAREETGQNQGNPFPLMYEGELLLQ